MSGLEGVNETTSPSAPTSTSRRRVRLGMIHDPADRVASYSASLDRSHQGGSDFDTQ
jgi:hypothetical protein